MARAAAAGVTRLMCCGSREADWMLLPDIARRFPAVRLSFGLHPWHAAGRSAGWLDRLQRRLDATPAAIGEIGLDHALDPKSFPAQETVLLAQLRLAAERRRPVTLHCRRAWGRLIALLDDRGWPPAGFVLHAYSGSAELIPVLARRGAYFSFAGSITDPANRRGRAAVAAVPPDRLLVETDAPDLPAALPPDAFALGLHDRRPLSEPAHLAHVLRAVAELRGHSPAELAALTAHNATTLFGD